MPVKTNIADSATGVEAHVTKEQALLVSPYPSPPLLPQKSEIFRQYLTDDGTAAGDEDMQTAGSLAAPVDFYVKADDEDDRYISAVAFVIADDGAAFSKFGAIAALTNGCQFLYESARGEIFIHEALKTNWDFVRLALASPAFGTGKDAFMAKDIEGKVDAYIPTVDFLRLMPPFGIKLDRGSKQRLILRVRDDTTGVDSFNAIAYGFDRFE